MLKSLARVLVGAVGIVAGATAQTPAEDPVAAALLAKHRAFVGWHLGDGTFRTLRVIGSVSDERGKKTERFVRVSDGLVYHEIRTMLLQGNITEHTGFTGNLFWRADMNGFTTPIYGGYARYLASFTILQQEGTSELPGTFIQNKDVGGKNVAVVRVTLANGDPIDCYVDPQTGAYVQATIDPGGPYETTIHDISYRDALPGKKTLASYRSGNDKSLRSFDSYQPNVPVSTEQLHPPGPTASWTFANSDPFPITLTRTRMLLDATVNGVKGRFILDTGASAIILDDAFAERANAPALQGGGELQTLYGTIKSKTRRVESLTLGGATLHNVLVYSEDFRSHDYRGLDRASYDGLIGYDLFAGAIVKLELYASKMTIQDASGDLSGVKGLPLLVDLSEGIPVIPMTLNNSIAVNAFLDTGNPGLILFGPDLRLKHHLRIWGCGNIDRLNIGPITYSGEEACEWGLAADNMLLGYDFLKHFDYVFDYPHGRMFMLPNRN